MSSMRVGRLAPIVQPPRREAPEENQDPRRLQTGRPSREDGRYFAVVEVAGKQRKRIAPTTKRLGVSSEETNRPRPGRAGGARHDPVHRVPR